MSDVVVLKTDEDTVERNVVKMFDMAGGVDKYILSGDRVLIKPNFLGPKKSSTGTTTDLGILESLIKLVLGRNATPIIGEGVPIVYDVDTTFKRVGVHRLAEKYGIELVNMDRYPHEVVRFDHPVVLKEIPVSRLVFEVDRIINVPVMKTHTQTTVTLGMKNLKGCVPGKHKLTLHRLGVSEGVVDLNTVVKPTFTVIDGIVGMEGNGPMNGRPKRMNLLVGSDDVLALEIVGAKIMGFDPYTIRHIYLARDKGIGEYDLKNIRVLGEPIDAVRSEFSFPMLNTKKWLGPLLFNCVIPMLARVGLDVTACARWTYDRFTPYPTFGDRCTGCGKCIKNCPEGAIRFAGEKRPVVDKKKCIKCYVCDEVCMAGNVEVR